jgi:hypothetical protein
MPYKQTYSYRVASAHQERFVAKLQDYPNCFDLEDTIDAGDGYNYYIYSSYGWHRWLTGYLTALADTNYNHPLVVSILEEKK